MMWILIGVIVLLVVITVGIYNNLVKARNRVEQADSDIDVQLKRRYDLIPNLIETVKGYAKHEKQTFDAVVKARNDAMNQKVASSNEGQQAENMLESTLKSLFALAESYPDLKASTNFVELQRELSDTENKIQAARRLYNGTLREYTDTTQLFPNNVLASLFNFKVTGSYFEVADSEAGPVKVNF